MASFRMGATLRELRIHLCQTNTQSKGVREFIQKYYVDIKKENPQFPILIRECSGVQPRVWARYVKGEERSTPLTDLSADNVLSTIKQLAKTSTKLTCPSLGLELSPYQISSKLVQQSKCEEVTDRHTFVFIILSIYLVWIMLLGIRI